MNIEITIIEDNHAEKNNLLTALQNWELSHNAVFEIKHFCSGENYFNSNNVDTSHLYILDIQLPDMNGIEIAQQMRARGYNGTILFLSAFREYVFEGYEVRALNYLLKPVSQSALNKCLDDIQEQFKNDFFVFRVTDNYIQIPYNEIICFSVHNHNIDITTTKEVYSFRSSLKNILPFLPNTFVQCHRSSIVNMRHIFKLDGSTITLSNKTHLLIGRNYIDAFRHDYATFSMRLF